MNQIIDLDEWARGLTKRGLATELRNGISASANTVKMQAVLAEAARRLEQPIPQTLVSLHDGTQVYIEGSRIMQRGGTADCWSLPLERSDWPHQPGTFYQGKW